MSESPPIPIICCGKREEVGRIVIDGLKPEVEVVHFVLAGESGTAIIPPLLAGQQPPSHPELSTIGSGNYSQIPQAVVLGGAFDDESVATLRDAARSLAGTRKVPWIRQDKDKNKVPVMSPGYIPDVIVRSKEVVTRLAREGKLDGTYDGLEYY